MIKVKLKDTQIYAYFFTVPCGQCLRLNNLMCREKNSLQLLYNVHIHMRSGVYVWFSRIQFTLWVTSYLPLVSCLTRHIRCWEAPKAVLHWGSPKRVSHVPRRGISSQSHGVLWVVVQIVVVRKQRWLIKAAVVGGF